MSAPNGIPLGPAATMSQVEQIAESAFGRPLPHWLRELVLRGVPPEVAWREGVVSFDLTTVWRGDQADPSVARLRQKSVSLAVYLVRLDGVAVDDWLAARNAGDRRWCRVARSYVLARLSSKSNNPRLTLWDGMYDEERLGPLQSFLKDLYR